ncbi:MAG: 3-hydroxy-5-phosphonooxypentane-2,4-dione thiolase LsrF, partial [Candidatus Omnitrophica bacterium]|nr:3-hydroxy-5-phosphonooxypentane-2,4-dione thiolase LsrF [Candidatus Omnitrophota bacterium]
MPEKDSREEKNFFPEQPQRNKVFSVKGCHNTDWGLKNRLARIFRPRTGKSLMLAIDHGYFQGPTTGLERVDITILPLLKWADSLMLTRGILRSIIPPEFS